MSWFDTLKMHCGTKEVDMAKWFVDVGEFFKEIERLIAKVDREIESTISAR